MPTYAQMREVPPPGVPDSAEYGTGKDIHKKAVEYIDGAIATMDQKPSALERLTAIERIEKYTHELVKALERSE